MAIPCFCAAWSEQKVGHWRKSCMLLWPPPLVTCWPAHPHPHTLTPSHPHVSSHPPPPLSGELPTSAAGESGQRDMWYQIQIWCLSWWSGLNIILGLISELTPFLVFIWSQISLVWVRRWKDSCFAACQDGCCLRDVDCNVVNLSFVAKCNFPQAFVMATLSKKQIYDARSQWEILKSIQTLSTSLRGCRIRMLSLLVDCYSGGGNYAWPIVIFETSSIGQP